MADFAPKTTGFPSLGIMRWWPLIPMILTITAAAATGQAKLADHENRIQALEKNRDSELVQLTKVEAQLDDLSARLVRIENKIDRETK